MRMTGMVLALMGMAGIAAAQTSAPARSHSADVGRRAVIVINFDPVLKMRGGRRLHEVMQWSGFYNNWWEYIVNYDEAMQAIPPPGATFEKARVAMYAE